MIELIIKYASYNLWANLMILNKLNTLPEDILNKELKSSFRSISRTILHIYDAETIWLRRLEGHSLNNWPSEDFSGTTNEALQMLENASKNIRDYVKNISAESLYNECTFTSFAGVKFAIKVHDVIQHCMNHSTFHRGQIVTMLRELDITELPSTDYIAYIRTHERQN
ncbi:MAG TPA: DinB family protein [Ignavibacteria bacterium]|nr:DinB family protein [Ignavibacteria bacterium]HMQ98892.1 DinB family protein [Ignavibacteria bacterium]